MHGPAHSLTRTGQPVARAARAVVVPPADRAGSGGMDHTALLVLTVLCFVVGLGAELIGVALAVSEVRSAGRALRRWREAHRAGDPPGSGPARDLDQVVGALLGNPFDRVSAAVLVVLGIVAGAAGNVLSLAL